MADKFTSRFEEVAEEDDEDDEEEEKPAKAESKKRPREEDAMEVEPEQKLSKSQKKKLNKKLKAADGQAVPAGEAEKPKEEATPKKEKKEAKKEKKEKESKKEENKEKKTLDGGVQIEDKKVGTGAQAKKGDVVSMRYVGKLTNGKIFDQNIKGKPVRTFALFGRLLPEQCFTVQVPAW